ncbi:MAG: hypothetical protein HY814_02550 [Candidatus Riflebacteria bacterium]|nr:hypothetical protein [Candidatus Riflebacteria bacterium]
MTLRARSAFTLLELLVVVVVSAGMAIVIAIFLQKGISSYTLVDDEAELTGRVKFMMQRLRKCARHSISGFCNFRNPPTPTAFAATETLFFLTDFDQNGRREAHFVWFDRKDATRNPRGTGQLVHCWKERVDALTWGSFDGMEMPPDMSDSVSPTFLNLLDHLQTKTNFTLPMAGTSTAQRGWEVLLDSNSSALPTTVSTWTAPPGWGNNPPFGMAFLVDNTVTLTAGNPPTWGYPLATTAGSLLNLLSVVGPPNYQRPPGALGSPTCLVYARLFVDRNANRMCEPEEAAITLMTTINMLLIPSAGTATP